MKKFAINISYSWGDKEEPIVIERDSEEEAFDYMLDLAMKETKVVIREHEDWAVTIKVMPFWNEIVLYYAYDGEECYYRLTEILEEELMN